MAKRGMKGLPGTKFWEAMGLAALLSAGGNLALLWLVRQAGYAPWAAHGNNLLPEPIGYLNVALASVIPAAGAFILLEVLRRMVKRPVRVFMWVAAAFLLFSLGGPAFARVNALYSRFVLAAMHLISAASIVWVVRGMPGNRK